MSDEIIWNSYSPEDEEFDIVGRSKGEPDIQALLDRGYEQLDGFVAWLETSVGVDSRTAQQDCFNAEALIDFLANQHRKDASQINEFELRWFVFSHYIRKANADVAIEERLPVSLGRFFHYLEAKYGYQVPIWVESALDDEEYYLKRRSVYLGLDGEDERRWEEGFKEWCLELEEDLDTRCLWLPRDLGDGMLWSDTMGWREATLQEEANIGWQNKREEGLKDGMDFDVLRHVLLRWYNDWLDMPQPRLDGYSPREVIHEEHGDREEGEQGMEE